MFDKRLRDLRKSKGLSTAEIAEILQMTERKWKSYENNEREPDSETLIKIALFFDVSIDYLLNFSVDSIDVNSIQPTEKEYQVLLAYRQQPNMHEAIDRILKLDEN